MSEVIAGLQKALKYYVGTKEVCTCCVETAMTQNLNCTIISIMPF
jgi:hypothetical protein